jgi:hypothetical protein
VDKLLILFRRLPGLSSAEFHRHYLEVHAPMATRWARVIHRYVVNVTDQQAPAHVLARLGPAPTGDWQFDAVTEAWVDSVAAYHDHRACFAEVDQYRAMRADHESFIGPMHGYRVEEHVASSGPASVAGRTPGVKLVLVAPAAVGGTPAGDGTAPDGTRVIHSRVIEAITPDSPPLAWFTEVTAATGEAAVEAVGALPDGVCWYLATEHVQRP